MRFASRYQLASREGEERTRRKFLLRPRCFGQSHWRWLTTAPIREQIVKQDIGGSMEWGQYKWTWTEVGFAD